MPGSFIPTESVNTAQVIAKIWRNARRMDSVQLGITMLASARATAPIDKVRLNAIAIGYAGSGSRGVNSLERNDVTAHATKNHSPTASMARSRVWSEAMPAERRFITMKKR